MDVLMLSRLQFATATLSHFLVATGFATRTYAIYLKYPLLFAIPVCVVAALAALKIFFFRKALWKAWFASPEPAAFKLRSGLQPDCEQFSFRSAHFKNHAGGGPCFCSDYHRLSDLGL